jgi:hypothetical protein
MPGTPELSTDIIIQAVVGQRLAPDFKMLQRLRQSGRITLERYVDLASQAAGHLSRLTPGTVSDLGRANLALLQQREDRPTKPT